MIIENFSTLSEALIIFRYELERETPNIKKGFLKNLKTGVTAFLYSAESPEHLKSEMDKLKKKWDHFSSKVLDKEEIPANAKKKINGLVDLIRDMSYYNFFHHVYENGQITPNLGPQGLGNDHHHGSWSDTLSRNSNNSDTPEDILEQTLRRICIDDTNTKQPVEEDADMVSNMVD